MAPLPQAAPFFRVPFSLNRFAGRSRQHGRPAGYDSIPSVPEIVTQQRVGRSKQATPRKKRCISAPHRLQDIRWRVSRPDVA